jgi:hypothetical protein
MKNGREKILRVSMIVVTTVVCAIIICFMYVYYQYKQRLYFITPTISVSPPGNFFKDHPLFGFANNTGAYSVTLTTPKADKPYVWTVTTNKDGYRITSNSTRINHNKPGIWIYGCSYTWGWAVNDQDTFPWLIQQRYPEYDVRNYAIGGYGNVHALLQLRDELSHGKKPLIAVFGYNSFHLPRNVAAPSRIKEFQAIRDIGLLHHPMALVDAGGKLEIKYIPLVFVDMPDPDSNTMINVTRRIFDEIYEICRCNNIEPILAFQTGDESDPIVRYCKERGFTIADISLDNTKPGFNNLPYDIHPNYKAHKVYAEKLIPVIQKLINSKEPVKQ